MNAFFAEFFGTAMIIVFGGGVVANVLLDKDQKIIGRNLRGEDLMNKLVEVMGPANVEKKVKGSKSKK